MRFKSKIILITLVIIISVLNFPSHFGVADVGDSQENPIVITKRDYENVQISANSSKWFELPMNGRLLKDVSIEFDNSTANLDLYLWDSSFILVNSTSFENSESLSYYQPSHSSYFVEIRNLNLFSTGIFNLSILPDDEYEDNNGFENATVSYPYYGLYLDYLILNDREVFNITFLNDSYVNVWVNWFGDFHHGIVELYGWENYTLLDSKTYFGGFSTTHISYIPISNGTVSIVINDDQDDLGIYYSIRIDILNEDGYELNNDITTPYELALNRTYYQPYTYYGKFYNLTMTDSDFFIFSIPSPVRTSSEQYTILIFVNYSSYIYGYVPSLTLSLYSSEQTQLERSFGETDYQGVPFSKIYHTVNDSAYSIGIAPMKSDYFVRYSITIVIYEGPPAEDPWAAISLTRPGEYPYGPDVAIPGFPILFVTIFTSIAVLTLYLKNRYYFKKIRVIW